MSYLKTLLVICNKPTSTLTKGKAYSAKLIKGYESSQFWSNQRADCYRLTNDNGKTVNVAARRFTVKK